MRLKPRPNPEVNAYWMCDYGRLNYGWMNRKDRIEAPLVREGGKLVPTSWSEALQRLAEAARGGDGRRRGRWSRRSSANEDLGAAAPAGGGAGRRGGRLPLGEGRGGGPPGLPAARAARGAGGERAGARSCFGLPPRRRRRGAGGAGGGGRARGRAAGARRRRWRTPRRTSGRRPRSSSTSGRCSSPAARNAHFVLPATTFAEMEGSFTNVHAAGAALLARAAGARDGAARVADPRACCWRGSRARGAGHAGRRLRARWASCARSSRGLSFADLGAQGGRCRVPASSATLARDRRGDCTAPDHRKSDEHRS